MCLLCKCQEIVWFGWCIGCVNVKKRVWFGRRICIPVKKRFPTLQHLVESGILNDNEREIIQKIDEMYIQVKNAGLKNGTSFWQQLIRRITLPTELFVNFH